MAANNQSRPWAAPTSIQDSVLLLSQGLLPSAIPSNLWVGTYVCMSISRTATTFCGESGSRLGCLALGWFEAWIPAPTR